MKTKHHRFFAATAAFLAALAAALVLAQRSAASPSPGPQPDESALAAQLRFLAKRSLQGDAEATFEFARRVELGIGTEPDPAEAAYWYEVAEEQGYTLPADVIERLFL
ncbi:MAG: sel1 repeat family protein [Kiritimatiellae bacterium]|nr:sel1 repeat family protein [Kiritimatiellia bacterium]